MSITDPMAAALDSCLSIRQGVLHLEDVSLVDLAARFGTPLYVVSEGQLRRNARAFRAAFAAAWTEGPVRILPSIKANFSLALRRILTDEELGCDTFGAGELHAALRSGVPPELISVNGTAKDRGLIERAVSKGAKITLDSAVEIDLVRKVARDLGMQAVVRVRLRPDYQGLDQPSEFYAGSLTVAQAAARYKPGIPLEDLIPAGREALHAPELQIRGVMAHLGRHSADLAVWRRMAASIADVVAILQEAWDGWMPQEIDLGGGFAVPRDPFGRAHGRENAPPAPAIPEYAEAMASGLRQGLLDRGLSPIGIALEVEPGRAMYGNTGVHLAAVRNIKEQSRPFSWRWVETDTSDVFLLDTVLEGNRWIVVPAGAADAPPTQQADIVGLSCGFDVIVGQASVPALTPGDILAFLDTGAYQDASANNFNALPRPATVLVSGERAETIKRRETLDDVFSRDVIPPRLDSLP
ncbi:MAG TPA: hypothetical protein VFB58_03880 [Chloroflexota bacterium]|nr:hypothetical protein [Chloroflexota bacterium]